MSISIAHSRQHLSSLIEAAQTAPQIITKRNAPVAVLVSPDYFGRTEHAAQAEPSSFYDRLVALRATYALPDNSGLAPVKTSRQAAWKRANSFAASE